MKMFPYPCYYLCRRDDLFFLPYLVLKVISVEKTLASTFTLWPFILCIMQSKRTLSILEEPRVQSGRSASMGE
jgi:hypothetical protein